MNPLIYFTVEINHVDEFEQYYVPDPLGKSESDNIAEDKGYVENNIQYNDFLHKEVPNLLPFCLQGKAT